ncbi:MAG: hypothetical protein N3C62_06545 [Synergistetes bacterium]|nr:hypothetical protein [Synergistota bacterium]MCX8128373.1 hypothetical protein [Synergistota bacterium]MDW8192969.1 hypothetical protein [Synergistota bacterium]
MVKVFVDEEERIDLEDMEVGEVVSKVEEELKRSGRVITRVELDGKPLGERKLEEVDVSKVKEISFFSKSVVELVRESLTDLQVYLPRLAGGLKDIASLFRVGEFKKALMLLPKAVEGIGWLIKVFEYTALLLGVEWKKVEGIDFETERDLVITRLGEVSKALEDRDFIRLSDLLAYEVAPTVEEWGKLTDYLLSLARQLRH